jgi:hypothetical protein
MFLAISIPLFLYQYLSSPVDVKVNLSLSRDPTIPAENIIVVGDAKEFISSTTTVLRMSRWKAWQFDNSKPFYVLEQPAGRLTP